jgi:hypothetical protein
MTGDQQRKAWLECHLAHAAQHFTISVTGQPVYTSRLHSVGAKASTATGPAWLRVVYEDPEWGQGHYLDGNLTANDIRGVPKPIVTAWHEWDDSGRKLRAELSTYIPDRPVAADMILTTEPELPGSWFTELRTVVDALAAHPLPRHGLDPDDLNNGIQAFFGLSIDITAVPWTTAHRDLHWANITAPHLHVLDWEMWGKAPAGYDAATLHCSSLLAPTTAHRIHTTLAANLDTHTGHIATLAAAVRLLRFADEGDYLPLAQPLHQHATAIADKLRSGS